MDEEEKNIEQKIEKNSNEVLTSPPRIPLS
jgi:hypothetical protein